LLASPCSHAEASASGDASPWFATTSGEASSDEASGARDVGSEVEQATTAKSDVEMSEVRTSRNMKSLQGHELAQIGSV
jgi:hypothetical protein